MTNSSDISIKLFGDRVLLDYVPTKPGAIHIPERARNRDIHRVGKVIAVGDGQWSNKAAIPMVVKKGDIVYFQTNELIAASNGINWRSADGKETMFLVMLQGDLIAKVNTEASDEGVSETDVSVETFDPIGKWCLLKPTLRQEGTIIIPANAKDGTSFQFHVVKKGPLVTLPIEVGNEVSLRMDRCNLVLINREEYAYIDEQYITGVIG